MVYTHRVVALSLPPTGGATLAGGRGCSYKALTSRLTARDGQAGQGSRPLWPCLPDPSQRLTDPF